MGSSPGCVDPGARPGGNVTGVYMLAAELEAKRLELLLETLPNAPKVAILNPGSDSGGDYFAKVRRVAQATNVQLYMTDVPSAESYEPVFEAMMKERPDVLSSCRPPLGFLRNVNRSSPRLRGDASRRCTNGAISHEPAG
jgi:putative tryptophan/tyrosine transport system substrate-binding protein